MRYLLDTNAWANFLNKRYPSVAERIRSAHPDDLAMSTVVLAELRYGADKSQNRVRNHARIDIIAREAPRLDFDAPVPAGSRDRYWPWPGLSPLLDKNVPY